MRRIAVLTLGLAVLGTLLYAQTGDAPQQDNRQPRRRLFNGPDGGFVEKLSLTGTLGLSRGVLVLKTGDEIWYAPELQRYIGFIDDLKEGAAASLEGWGRKIPQIDENAGVLRVSKLTLNGRDYEVGPEEPWVAREPDRAPGRRDHDVPGPRGWGHRGRMGPMMRPGWGPRDHLPEIRRHFQFRTEPQES
jgi:hypothetical protein